MATAASAERRFGWDEPSPRLPPLSRIASFSTPRDAQRARPISASRMNTANYGVHGPYDPHAVYPNHDSAAAAGTDPTGYAAAAAGTDPTGYAAAAAAADARGAHGQHQSHAYGGAGNVPYNGYSLYSPDGAEHASFPGQTYRPSRQSSSSSLGGYGMAADSMYSPPGYGDQMSGFHPAPNGSNGYSVDTTFSRAATTAISPPMGYPVADGTIRDYQTSAVYPDHSLDRRSSHLSMSNYRDEPYASHSSLDLGFAPPPLPPLQDPSSRSATYSDGRSTQPSPTLPGSMGSEVLGGVVPQATNMIRSNGTLGYEHHYMSATPEPSSGSPGALPSHSGDQDMRFTGRAGDGSDLASFMRPMIEQYVRSPNRLACGERTIIVMSSKVAQKSYGTEKRFLCPPPTAILIGNSWWSEVDGPRGDAPMCPPRVTVSISGEPPAQEGTIDWCSASGKSFDVADPPSGTTYVGRCIGKQLFISDVDEKRKKVEALIKVTIPAADGAEGPIIGTFPSRPIKVISKPSKKRQSAKNLELCINHGSTVSLFHRLRSQTVSTKYLCVSGSGSAFKGSDGAPLIGLDTRARQATPSFIAKTNAWDPFVLYIVDVSRQTNGGEQTPLTPPQAEYPSPPPNAIPFTNNGSPIPIYYNQTVVLQCLTSGVVSPILIIRKVDHATTAVGGTALDGVNGHTGKPFNQSFCAPGEVCGDPVSQLHKIAFEVYDGAKAPTQPGTPGLSGAFLSCMGEKVNTYRPMEGRQWCATHVDSPMQSPILSASPPLSHSASYTSVGDYFGGMARATGGLDSPGSPMLDFPSSDGGKVRRTKRAGSSAGARGGKGGRRRPTSANSTGSSLSMNGGGRQNSFDYLGGSGGANWQVDIGEQSVWTIVGVDQVRYNFYIPPILFDNQHMSQGRSWPIPSKPITPFPSVVKYLPPERASELPRQHFRPPLPTDEHAAKMLTLYGENFSKTEPVSVFFGAEPSPYVEVRCTEVVGCLPPPPEQGAPAAPARRPVLLVRSDGVVYPSTTMYP